MPEKWILRQYQALPLQAKVSMSLNRIREWYSHWNGDVMVSFSGGKDSTVLAHLVHEFYPEVPLVFSNTGLEFPEIQAFAKKMGAEFIRPRMSFSEVISKYGYPIISKENAEAIYYARRIRNSGGGCATPERKRTELEGRRLAGVAEPTQNYAGVVSTHSQETRGITRDPSVWKQGFLETERRRANLQYPGGGGYLETRRKRHHITSEARYLEPAKAVSGADKGLSAPEPPHGRERGHQTEPG